MVYIRADMNNQIGTGHIMRCLAIADAIRELGSDAVFILADHYGEDIIHQKGFDTICLNSIWNELDTEISTLLQVLWERQASLLLIDSYFVTEYYLVSLSKKVRICYIDDLFEVFSPCNLLINYSAYYRKFNYKPFFYDDSLLLGCSYVPLRKEFKSLPAKKIKQTADNLLIMSGGTDNHNVIGQILEALITRPLYNYTINVICGRFNSHYSELRQIYHTFDNIKVESTTDNLIDYMLKADIAISAGGTTLYELSACGIPTVCYSLADNQLDNVRQFAEDRLMIYAGDIRDASSTVSNIIDEAFNLAADYAMRKQMSYSLQKLVDGNGARRIAERLEELDDS